MNWSIYDIIQFMAAENLLEIFVKLRVRNVDVIKNIDLALQCLQICTIFMELVLLTITISLIIGKFSFKRQFFNLVELTWNLWCRITLLTVLLLVWRPSASIDRRYQFKNGHHQKYSQITRKSPSKSVISQTIKSDYV